MKIETVKLSRIKQNPENPRIIKDSKYESLKKSLKDFPEMMQLREIVVDENYMVLGGNMRLKAMKEIGINETVVKIAIGLTEDQKKEFIIKDNVPYGEWDYEMLANDWDVEDLKDWGMDIPAFNCEQEDQDIMNEPDGDPTNECPKCGYIW